MRKEPPSQPLNAMGGRSRRKSGCPSDVPSTPEGRLVAMILPVVRNVLPRLDTHVGEYAGSTLGANMKHGESTGDQ